MRTANARSLMQDIRSHNPQWFARGNKRFFGDIGYKAYYGRATGERYLIRLTNAWTDMFGSPKRAHYRVNPIGENYEILPLVETQFATLAELKAWLKVN